MLEVTKMCKGGHFTMDPKLFLVIIIFGGLLRNILKTSACNTYVVTSTPKSGYHLFTTDSTLCEQIVHTRTFDINKF